MKRRFKQGRRRVELRICSWCSYLLIDKIVQLEKILIRRPRRLQIDLIGSGEIDPDSALCIRSVLLKRSSKTHIVTNAHSSLQNGAVMVWLLGDSREIREDARLFFKPVTEPEVSEENQATSWKGKSPAQSQSTVETDPNEADHARVLEIINEFLPVRELAGRVIDTSALRQFGLVDCEATDRFLAEAFGKVRMERRRPAGSQAQPKGIDSRKAGTGPVRR